LVHNYGASAKSLFFASPPNRREGFWVKSVEQPRLWALVYLCVACHFGHDSPPTFLHLTVQPARFMHFHVQHLDRSLIQAFSCRHLFDVPGNQLGAEHGCVSLKIPGTKVRAAYH
jgi:hypothetical protein